MRSFITQSLGQATPAVSLTDRASVFVSANWKWLLGGLGLFLVLRSARVLNRGRRSRKSKARRRQNPFSVAQRGTMLRSGLGLTQAVVTARSLALSRPGQSFQVLGDGGRLVDEYKSIPSREFDPRSIARNPFVLRKMPENVRVGEAHSLAGARGLAKSKGRYIVVEETDWRRSLADEFTRNPFTVQWRPRDPARTTPWHTTGEPLSLGTRETFAEAEQQRRNLISMGGYPGAELSIEDEG